MATILDLYKISQIIAIKNITCGNFHYERRHFAICDWQSASSDIRNLLMFLQPLKTWNKVSIFMKKTAGPKISWLPYTNSNELCILSRPKAEFAYLIFSDFYVQQEVIWIVYSGLEFLSSLIETGRREHFSPEHNHQCFSWVLVL